jgi:PIN domain nuclease of toxin-antitoxin system
MGALVADTHTAIWHFNRDPRLSPTARKALNDTLAAGDPILLASISLVEMTYLVEKGRIPSEFRIRMVELLNDSERPLLLVPLDAAVAAAVERIERKAIPDLPDRVIAATALARNVPLVTRDEMIRASGVPTIW